MSRRDTPPPPDRSARSGNPAVRAGKVPPSAGSPAPPAGGRFAERLASRSMPLVAWLNKQPRFLFPLLMGVLLVAGLALTGPLAWLGAVCLLLILVFVGWLILLTWPVLNSNQRMLRVGIIGALLAALLLKAVGRF